MEKNKKETKWPWEDIFGDYSLVPVPNHAQKSGVSMLFVLAGIIATVAVLMGGSALGTQFNVNDAVKAIIGGCAVLTFIGGLIAYIGQQAKSTTYICLRYSFGMQGSQLVGSLLGGFIALGWFAVQTWMFGLIVSSIAPGYWWSSIGFASIWGGLLMMTTAYIGFKALTWLSYLAVPFFILLCLVGLFIGVDKVGGFAEVFAMGNKSSATLYAGITQVIGMFIGAAILIPDILRFAKTGQSAVLAWVLNLALLGLMLIGAVIMTASTGAANIAESLILGGIGLGAFLFVFLGQWTTNDSNLYITALSFNTWIHVEKRYLTIAAGIVGTGIAAYVGFVEGSSLNPFIQFLTVLGTYVPAIGGIMIADYYLYRGVLKEPMNTRYNMNPGMTFSKLNWIGLSMAVVGGYIGGSLVEIGIPAINSLVVAGGLYFVLSYLCDQIKIPREIGNHSINNQGI